ncbi:MAG: DUF308 domain-containing protein [Sarcina sp.]
MKALCILEGILLAIIGFILISKPIHSLFTVTTIIGVLLIAYSIIKFIRLWKSDQKVLHIIMCIIDFLFGCILIANPLGTVTNLIILYGIWSLIRGIYTVIYSIKARSNGFKAPIIYGVLLIIFGIIIFIDPFVAIFVLPVIPLILGIYFIVIAIVEIYIGFKI